MNREKQIKNAAEGLYSKMEDLGQKAAAFNGFMRGAKFADCNPQGWISAKEQLPDDGEWCVIINIAMLPAAFVSQYVDDGEGLVILVIDKETGEAVLKIPATHWLPVMPPPRFNQGTIIV